MNEGKWNFEVVPRRPGAMSTVYDHALEGTSLTTEEKLIREVIQNSKDARVGDKADKMGGVNKNMILKSGTPATNTRNKQMGENGFAPLYLLFYSLP